MLLLLLLMLLLVMVVVQEHIGGGNGLHDIVDVVEVVSLAVRRKQVGVCLLLRRRQDVCLLVVPQQVVERRQELSTARVVFTVVCFQRGKIQRCVWRRKRSRVETGGIYRLRHRAHTKQAPSWVYEVPREIGSVGIIGTPWMVLVHHHLVLEPQANGDRTPRNAAYALGVGNQLSAETGVVEDTGLSLMSNIYGLGHI